MTFKPAEEDEFQIGAGTADATYEEMNKTLGIDHTKRRVGEGIGLGPDDIEKVLQSHGIVWRT